MRPLPSRFPVFRRPSLHRTVSIGLAIAAAVTLFQASAGARAASARFGETATVWVMTDDVDAGDRVGAADVARAARPVAFVPPDAVTEDPTGRTAVGDLVAGEVVVSARISGTGAGVNGLIPEGWRAVAIPAFEALPPLERGDLVDLVGATGGASGSGQAAVLVSGAVVVDVADGESVTVAVPAERVPLVADVLTGGVVLVVLVG